VTLSLHASPDGQWCAVRRGKQTAWYALGPTAGVDPLEEPQVRVELPEPASDLVVIGPPTQAITVTRSGDSTSIELLSSAKLERIAALTLAGRWTAAAVTGSRAALLSEDARTCTVIRAAAKSLVAQLLEPGAGLIDLVLGMERQQLAIGTTKRLEVWDAVSTRPLTRLQVQLPPPPRTIGTAAGHWWILRAEQQQILLMRLSDGRPFLHNLGAPIRSVVSHPASPWLVVVTSRGLVRLSCFAHAMAELEAPPAEAYAIAPSGDEAVLLGASGFAQAPWVMRLSASAAATGVPRVTTGVVVTTSPMGSAPIAVAVAGKPEPRYSPPAAASVTATAERLREMRDRAEAVADSEGKAERDAAIDAAAEPDAEDRSGGAADDGDGAGEDAALHAAGAEANAEEASEERTDHEGSGEQTDHEVSGERTDHEVSGERTAHDASGERTAELLPSPAWRSTLGGDPQPDAGGRAGAAAAAGGVAPVRHGANGASDAGVAPSGEAPSSSPAATDQDRAGPPAAEAVKKPALPSWALNRRAPGAAAAPRAPARPVAWPPTAARQAPAGSSAATSPVTAAAVSSSAPASDPETPVSATLVSPVAASAAPAGASPASGAARPAATRPGAPSWFAGAAARAQRAAVGAPPKPATNAAGGVAAATLPASPAAGTVASSSAPPSSAPPSSAASSTPPSSSASPSSAALNNAASNNAASSGVPEATATSVRSTSATNAVTAIVSPASGHAGQPALAGAAAPSDVPSPAWYDATTPVGRPASTPASSSSSSSPPRPAPSFPSFGPAEHLVASGGPRPVPEWASTEPLPRAAAQGAPAVKSPIGTSSATPIPATSTATPPIASRPLTAPPSPLAPAGAAPARPAPMMPAAAPPARPAPIPPSPMASSAVRAAAAGGARSWRGELAIYGAQAIAGVPGAPPEVHGNELAILARRLSLPEEARLASTILYAAWLAGQPFLPIVQLAALLGEGGWPEALGTGALGQLGLLRHRDGAVALRRSVADALDGRPWGAIRVAGDADAVPLPLPGRLGRVSVSAWPAWQAYLGKVALVTGKLRRALVEARLAELVAVTFDPLVEYPAPWPTGTNLLVVSDAIGGLTELLPELLQPPG
jgi:hypothetical protein